MAFIQRIFLDVDFRCAHDGLATIAAKEDIDVSQLKPGEFIVFLNTGKDRIKVFTANHVVAYYRSPYGKVDLRTLTLIPKAFGATGKINYDAALKEVIESAFRRKEKSRQSLSA